MTVADFVEAASSGRSGTRRALIRFFHQPAGVIGVAIIGLFVLLALFAPLFSPHDPLTPYRGEELVAPSLRFPFGTDPLGRDVLSRVIFGTRTSLIVGLVSVAIGALLGCSSGMVAAYLGGKFEAASMMFWSALFVLPPVLLGIMFATLLPPGTQSIARAVGVASAPIFARIARSAVLWVMAQGYIAAARSIGMTRWRLFWVHVVPNALSSSIVAVAIAMSSAVLLESALSFLGLGAPPPNPSWGAMLAHSQRFLREAWWYGTFPGLAVALLVLGFNAVGDSLRDALDPASGIDL
jgi:peptide/nickel transport system permease protein